MHLCARMTCMCVHTHVYNSANRVLQVLRSLGVPPSRLLQSDSMRGMEETRLRPHGTADLTPENLRAVLEDMGGGPGWYTSKSLYAWYTGMAREDNLEPVSIKKFGMVLGELGYQRALRRVDGKNTRSWFITARALRAS